MRIRSYVVETPVNEQVRLRSESAQVERKPVERPVAAGDALFQPRSLFVLFSKGEEADVATVELDQMVSGPAPRIRTEDGVTIIPVLEEVLVVEKRLVLKREIRIRKRSTSETVEIPVSLRKQRAEVECRFPRRFDRDFH